MVFAVVQLLGRANATARLARFADDGLVPAEDALATRALSFAAGLVLRGEVGAETFGDRMDGRRGMRDRGELLEDLLA